MVNKPVGPPSGPPVPTDGDRFLGSFSPLGVCAFATADKIKITSAQKSTLFASLIAFLLRLVSKDSTRPASEDNRAADLVLIRMPTPSISPPLSFGYGRSNYQRQQ